MSTDLIPRYMTTEEVAEAARMSIETIRWYRKTGGGNMPPGHKVGRRVLYRADEIARWLEGEYVNAGESADVP